MKPPPSNLGPMAEPWARWITDQTETNAIAIERMGGDASNDGRINNSALDSLADQINELNVRRAQVIGVASLVTPAMNAGSANQAVTTNVTIPMVDVPRWGWVMVSSAPLVSPALDTSVFCTYSIDGEVFYRSSAFFPIANTTPTGWEAPTFLGGTGFRGQPGGNTVTIRLDADPDALGASGSRTASLQNVSLTINYAQPV